LTIGPEDPLEADVTVRLKVVVRDRDPADPVTVIVEVASGVEAAV
jgi:hypothetical protein